MSLGITELKKIPVPLSCLLLVTGLFAFNSLAKSAVQPLFALPLVPLITFNSSALWLILLIIGNAAVSLLPFFAHLNLLVSLCHARYN